jgi:hypothetical protein
MQITQHLSNPSGNPQLALTFQPLVNMALNMQLSVRVRAGNVLGASGGRDRTERRQQQCHKQWHFYAQME